MSSVIKAVLSNPVHPEYGQLTVPFPVPNNEYDQLIEKLEAMEIGDPLKQDCRVDGLDSFYTVLNRLDGTVVAFDELDYLAKRLASFDDGEAEQFQAMAHTLGLKDIKDFINLTFCCQQATVISDFSKLERVGRDHAMNLNDGTMPLEGLKALDGRKTALRLIGTGAGAVTPYGVVYDNGMQLEPLYDGRHFPGYLYEPPVLTLEVSTMHSGLTGVLCLPMSDRQLQRLQLRAEADSPDAQLRVEMDELPEMVADALDLERLSGSDLPGLNRLCQAIQPMKETDMEKLNAVVLMTETSGIVSICQLAENLDKFDFVPGVRTPEEYGRYMIRESGRFEYDENLEEFYDYRTYGTQRVQEEGGQFTECGYVAYHGAMTLDELMHGDSADQHQQEQRLGMWDLS